MDHAWHLVPSILRRPVCKESVSQVLSEWLWLRIFSDHCDSIGLAIPNDSPEFREQFLNQGAPGLNQAFFNAGIWPPRELFELMALAQHHRLPTRLLDWSRRSYVAAYFAILICCRCLPTRLRIGLRSGH
jgi:hypothetical protein